jgi:hypothetical protein
LSVAGHDTEQLYQEEGSAEDFGASHKEYVRGPGKGGQDRRGGRKARGTRANATTPAASVLDFRGEVYQDDPDAMSG